jgi:dimethylamine/trimethylamine dehydrogenase
MSRDPRYDILFEPVTLGPVTAKNRFYQVPHCTGMGHNRPMATAGLRGMKAEGGWAVVCTEEAEIHASTDVAPAQEARLWEDADIGSHAPMVEAVHKHGALAGCELVHQGNGTANLYSRLPILGPSHEPVYNSHPFQGREMDLEDIRNLRRWYRDAALRAKKAGFDIVYVYAGHDLSVLMHFLQRRRNKRSDDYGGPFENRLRLLREVLEDTKEAVGESCAVAVRLAVEEQLGPEGVEAVGDGRRVIEALGEIPDLWDVCLSNWSNDSATARFSEEAFQEPFVSFVKQVTRKPVVGVGRFTSPDVMVAQVKRGILDMIGAARPSIADPFLPRKIEEGRLEDIRECIGCNICVSGDNTNTPIRCTQNPTMGEEWRHGWHPENIRGRGATKNVLVVGAGPAGLEAARALGARGYEVTLAEAERDLGGRISRECHLLGLSTWARVRDYRQGQLDKMANVEIYRESRLDKDQILEFGAEAVVIATGSSWCRDGFGRANSDAILGLGGPDTFTPDDIMADKTLSGPVVIFDDDHYYMGGVIAEKLAGQGQEVHLVTPAALASIWTQYTLEQQRIQKRLLERGVIIHANRNLLSFEKGAVRLACVFTGKEEKIACNAVVPVTARLPEDSLYLALQANPEKLREAGIAKLELIGDAFAPATIAAAVYHGHRFAQELDERVAEVPFSRELARTATELMS